MHQLVAAYLGYEPPAGSGPRAPARSAEASEQAVAALMAFAAPLPEHMRLNIPNPYSTAKH